MLPGLKAILNIHPLLVHFPIALWLGALVFELLAVLRSSDDWHRTAVRFLYFGTLAGLVTLWTGLKAEDSVPAGPAMVTVGIHQALMITTTSVAGALCLFAFLARSNFTQTFRKIMLAGLVVLAIVLTFGADRGVQLVYQYGVGVNWPAAQQQQQK